MKKKHLGLKKSGHISEVVLLLRWSHGEVLLYLFLLCYRKIGLIVGWICFVIIAYKASQVELDFSEFDPYSELGIDRVCYFTCNLCSI